MIDANCLPLAGDGGLMDLLQTLVDPRKPRGVRHPVVTIVAIAVCAALSGARSFCAIAQWAQGLSREALQQLGSKRWRPPSEPTIRRVLQRIDADRLDAEIGQWLTRHHPLAGRAVAVDGKTLRGGHDQGQPAPHLLSAILHQEAVVIGQIAVEEKTNEIPKLPQLLDPSRWKGPSSPPTRCTPSKTPPATWSRPKRPITYSSSKTINPPSGKILWIWT